LGRDDVFGAQSQLGAQHGTDLGFRPFLGIEHLGQNLLVDFLDGSQADRIDAGGERAEVAAQFAAFRATGPREEMDLVAGLCIEHDVLCLSDEIYEHILYPRPERAVEHVSMAQLPGMRERRTGTIININSDVGKVARDLAGAAYVSSKFGLMGLTQQINAEERANGVRACSICPRDVNTPLLDKRPQPPSPELRANMLQPEDLAACAWLVATLPHRVVLDEISLSTR